METIWLWTTEGWREYADIGYSDYSGGTVARSNVDSFEAMEGVTDDGGYHLGSVRIETGRKPERDPYFVPCDVPEACDVIRYCGSHGTRGVWVNASEDAPEVIRDALASLADYPVLDEERLSEIEGEAETEATPEYIRDLNRACGFDSDTGDEEDLSAVMAEANVYWEHETSGPYLDTKRLIPYWKARFPCCSE